MCSYEVPGWPGYRDLGFCDRYLGNGMKIFPYEHSSPVTGAKLFKQNNVALTTYRPKWHNFGLVCICSLGVCELSLLAKLQDSTKLWQWRTVNVYVRPFWLCFLNSLRSTGLKSPIWTHHRIRPGNRASPVTGLIWRGLKGPSVWWKTVTCCLKMLPSACGLGQHFQALGHSFSPYGPPSRQITYIYSTAYSTTKTKWN